jgi:2-iminobutanoate/2-iminopropanoate deaminase
LTAISAVPRRSWDHHANSSRFGDGDGIGEHDQGGPSGRLPILAPVKHARNPASIHPPLAGYSHQIELDGSERLLMLSGQVGMTREGQVPSDAAEQLDLALANVIRNVEDAGMSVADLVKVTFYLTEPIAQDRRAAILNERLGAHAPCMTLVFVAGLAAPALKVEIDAWAASPERADTSAAL